MFTFCFWPIKTWVDFTINKYSQLFKVNFPHFVLRKSSDTVLTWIFSLKHLIKILILFISWFGLQLLYHLPVDSRRLRVQTCIVQKTMWGPIMLVLHGFHAFNKRYKIYKKLFFLGLIYLAFRPVTLTADFTKTFKGMICHKIRDFMADFRWV